MSLYKINEIKLFGYHGVYEEEIKSGQYFYIDAVYQTQLDNKNINDDIISVIDYAEVCNEIKRVFNKKRYNLLETLLLDIKNSLMKKFNLKNITLTITKKNIKLDISVNKISVQI